MWAAGSRTHAHTHSLTHMYARTHTDVHRQILLTPFTPIVTPLLIPSPRHSGDMLNFPYPLRGQSHSLSRATRTHACSTNRLAIPNSPSFRINYLALSTHTLSPQTHLPRYTNPLSPKVQEGGRGGERETRKPHLRGGEERGSRASSILINSPGCKVPILAFARN